MEFTKCSIEPQHFKFETWKTTGLFDKYQWLDFIIEILLINKKLID